MSRHYDALFVLYCFRPPEDMEEIVGAMLSGWVYKDSKQGDNHPFADGKFLDISRVQEVVSEGDKIFIVTRNTTYLFIGTARAPDAAHEVYMESKLFEGLTVDELFTNPSPFAEYLVDKSAKDSMDEMAKVIKNPRKISLTGDPVD